MYIEISKPWHFTLGIGDSKTEEENFVSFAGDCGLDQTRGVCAKEPPVCASRNTLSEQGAWLYPANTLDLLDFSVYARPALFRET